MLSWTLRRPVMLHVVAWGLQPNSDAICVDLDTLRQALFFFRRRQSSLDFVYLGNLIILFPFVIGPQSGSISSQAT